MTRSSRPAAAKTALALVAAMLCLLALARPALADDYSVPSVSIKAEVQPDGVLSVTETRTFEFNESVNGVYWTLPLDAADGAGAARVDIEGIEADTGRGAREFRESPDAVSGDSGVYSAQQDGGALTLKVFIPSDSGDTAKVTVRYNMSGVVAAWADTAELYWKFVGDGWTEPSDNVELTVAFAGASGEPAPASEDFRVWAHGPLTGTVAPDCESKTATFSVPTVNPGEYAEARIAFPVAWVPRAQASAEPRLDTILAQEKEWADEANARREEARRTQAEATVAIVAVPALFFAATAAAKALKPAPKPRFTDDYLRDLPSGDHPAVIAAFMHGGDVGDKALVSTLMHLTEEGVIELEREEGVERGIIFKRRGEGSYRLRVGRDRYDAVTDSIDREALRLYFDGCPWEQGEGAQPEGSREQAAQAGTPAARVPGTPAAYRARTFEDLKDYAHSDATAYSERLENYKAEVSARLEARNLVASTGAGIKVASSMLGFIIAGGSIAAFLALLAESVTSVRVAALVAGLALTAGAVALGWGFRRLTPEGAELDARCRALKRWLGDFTRLDEAVPADLILWDKLLVMAVALGVSDEVLRQLADAVPPERRDMEAGGVGCRPVWWWCCPHAGMAAPASSLNQAFSASLASVASSADGSAGGLGGGFSVGGGGGGSGGGGGTF